MDIPPILIINLPDRRDRWVSIQNSLQTWNTKFERVEAVKKSPGWKGCSLSHRKCIEIAKQRQYPWVLIMEDDCLPSMDSKEQLRSLLPVLWERRAEWDVFNGGASQLKNIKNIQVVGENPPLFKIKGYGTQFCLIHTDFYDKFLSMVGEHLRIDVFYTESARVWSSTPHLATQLADMSDIEHKKVDYTDNFKQTEDILNNALFMEKWKIIPITATVVLWVGAMIGISYLRLMK